MSGINRFDAPAGFERVHPSYWPRSLGFTAHFRTATNKPRVQLTGGRKLTPPSWATRFVAHYRDGERNGPHPICELRQVPDSTFRQDGVDWDYLAVEWLP